MLCVKRFRSLTAMTSWTKILISNALSIACFGLVFFVLPPSYADETLNTSVASPHLDIRVEADRVYMDVQDAEISDVLNALARKADFKLRIGQGITGRVTIRFDGETPEHALKRLCQNRAIVFEYSPETNSYQIIKAGAFAEGTTGGSEARRTAGTSAAKGTDKTSAGMRGARKEPTTSLRSGLNQAGQKYLQVPERQYDGKGRLLYKPGEILVKFKEGIPAEGILALHQSFDSAVIDRIDRVRLHRVKLADGVSIAEAISLYTASDIVDNAETHALRYPNETPDDPKFPNQWGLERIRMAETWDVVKGNPDLIIAVIDTGIDYLHTDLASNIWMNPAELTGAADVDDDGNGYVDDILGWDFAGSAKDDENDGDNDPMDSDDRGHGTHVAGIIAAEADNGQGIAGINWHANLMALKVKADDSGYIEDFDIIEALYYAIDMGARIVNCSFGGEERSDNEENAFADLENAGVLAVCAAGNGDDTGNGIDTDGSIKPYPASYSFDNIISVAASDSNDQLADFSNYGATTVDLMAPGVSIESTVLNESYGSKQGTSMAVPHVTGVAGLLLVLDDTLTASEIKSAILNSVDRRDSLSGKLVSGGRLNALKAICSGTDFVFLDLSCDREIGLTDAILALQILSGMNPAVCTPCLTTGSGTIPDAKIGLPYALYILQRVSGIR